jgi:hypothetical protein
MKNILRYMMSMGLLLLMTACGGGGTGTSGIPNTSQPTLVLSMQGGASVASGSAGRLYATVKDSTGKPFTNPVMVVFTSVNPDKASISSAVNYAYTDSTGVAYIDFTATSSSTGYGQFSATAVAGGVSLKSFFDFNVYLPSTLKLGALTISSPSLTAYAVASVTVQILDQNGRLYTDQEVDVNFKASSGYFAASTVRSVGGIATATYIAPASSSFEYGADLTATLSNSSVTTRVNLVPQPVAGISYVSASPTTLSIAPNETILVKFLVSDALGLAKPSQAVTFAVTDGSGVTSSSNATLVATTAVSDAFGNVTAAVRGGSTSSTFRIKAALTGLSYSTVTPLITVSNGLPGANSNLNISFTSLNLTAWSSSDGTSAGTKGIINPTATSTVTVWLTDSLGKKVADGTIVNFETTGGTVDATCSTVGGTCSSTWRNNGAIPANGQAVVTAKTQGTSGMVSTTGTIIMASAQADKTAIAASDCKDVVFAAAAAGTASVKNCSVTVKDLLGNAMGSGATVSFTISSDKLTDSTFAVTPAAFTYPNTNASGGVVIPLVLTKTFVTNTNATGTLTVTVTASGLSTVSVIPLK